MSSHGFDELTKVLAGGTSRRGVVRLVGKFLLAGSAAGALTAIGSGAVGAASTCDPAACAAQSTPCSTCACGHAPATSQGKGNQVCICTAKQCPSGKQCCPSGKFAGQCRQGACPA